MMMFATRWITTTAILIAIAAPTASAQQQDQVKKGEYIAIAADCNGCHTATEGKPYAGGVELKTPFGKLVAPNITQDKETGIGDWSRDDFEKALRQGIGKDGQPLYPGMPYTSYTKMTDADLDALWAYMKTVEPVRRKIESNQLPFPYNVRSSVFAWQALYFEPGRFEPDPSKSDMFNRGAYLVHALTHCSACHTPRNTLGGAVSDQDLKGARVESWYAPNISNDENSIIHDWSKDRLTSLPERRYVQTQHDAIRLDGGCHLWKPGKNRQVGH